MALSRVVLEDMLLCCVEGRNEHAVIEDWLRFLGVCHSLQCHSERIG